MYGRQRHRSGRRTEGASQGRGQAPPPNSSGTAAAVASNLQQQVHLLELEIHARRKEAAEQERDRKAEEAILHAGRDTQPPPLPPQSSRFAARSALGRHAAGQHAAGRKSVQMQQ